MAQPILMLGATCTSSQPFIPSFVGQYGITCISPTAPAGETAQRLKSLSTCITAITRPGGTLDSPGRCVSQYTCCRIAIRSAGSGTNRFSRGAMSVYQTAASYRSAKHCACEMARWMTGPNAASLCWSARAGDTSRQQASADSRAARPPRKQCRVLTAQTGSDEVDRLTGRKLRIPAIAPVTVFQPAGFQSALRDHQPMRNAEELRVSELDAGPGIAVVIERLDAEGGELAVEAVGNFAYPVGLLQVERHEQDLEGRQRLRPDDAALIVILLDGGGHDARHTDAITTHEHG